MTDEVRYPSAKHPLDGKFLVGWSEGIIWIERVEQFLTMEIFLVRFVGSIDNSKEKWFTEELQLSHAKGIHPRRLGTNAYSFFDTEEDAWDHAKKSAENIGS